MDNSQSANATISKNNSYFVGLPRRQNQPIRQSQKSSKLLPLLPSPSIHQRLIGANPPATGTATTHSSSIMLDSLYPSTTTKRYINVSINRENVATTASSSTKG
jgi:hypothetical protein